MVFFQTILFHIIAGEERICMDTVLYGRVCFLSTAALFNCGLTNWSCISRPVKGDIMLVCMVSVVKLIPCNLSCMFCYFGLWVLSFSGKAESHIGSPCHLIIV